MLSRRNESNQVGDRSRANPRYDFPVDRLRFRKFGVLRSVTELGDDGSFMRGFFPYVCRC